jgi:hypothetical protein
LFHTQNHHICYFPSVVVSSTADLNINYTPEEKVLLLLLRSPLSHPKRVMQEEGLESNLVSMRVGFGVGFLRFQPLTVDWISLLFLNFKSHKI